jgi:hypothetical protein
LPPQRNRSVESNHSRILPIRVTLRPCAYHALQRLTPSTTSLVSFQPDTLTGLQPFRALPDGDRQRLSTGHPLMRLATDRRRTDTKPVSCAPSQDWPSCNELIEWVTRTHPSWFYGAMRFRRRRHCCRSGLASGVSSLRRLGHAIARFLRVWRPWLSWVSSSLGHSPSRALASRLPPQPHGCLPQLHTPCLPNRQR